MEFSHPIYDGAPESQGFGANPNNGFNGPGGHNGPDYAVPYDTPVKAAGDGVVEFEGFITGEYWQNPWWFTPGAGLTIALDHGPNEPDSTYSHLSRTVVDKGQSVKRGDVIGYVGNTGTVIPAPTAANPHAGAHLHFNMFPPGFDPNSPTYGTVNPTVYLSQSLQFRTVTAEVLFVRVAPTRNAAMAPGYPNGIARGATISVVGHVAGEEVTPGNNAWFKTKSGYFVWATGAGDDLSGIPDLN